MTDRNHEEPFSAQQSDVAFEQTAHPGFTYNEGKVHVTPKTGGWGTDIHQGTGAQQVNKHHES